MAPEHEQLAVADHTFRSLGRSTAVVLEFLIAVYVASLILVVATGGIDIGPIGLHDATRPILILLIIVPLRLSIDAGPSLTHRPGSIWPVWPATSMPATSRTTSRRVALPAAPAATSSMSCSSAHGCSNANR